MYKSKVKYEPGPNGLSTAAYCDARNKETYLRILSEVSGIENPSYSDEKAWYTKHIKSYSRPEAIRAFCSFCQQTDYSSKDQVDCEIRWGQEYPPQFEEGCWLNQWRLKNMQKYQPKKAKKITQKQSIAEICKQCQGVKQLDKNVQHCSAFYDGTIHSCPLHPYRMGKDYWSTREVSEETIKKMQEARRNGK